MFAIAKFLYLQLHQCLPLLRKCSPDGACPDWGCGHQITAYYSFVFTEARCCASLYQLHNRTDRISPSLPIVVMAYQKFAVYHYVAISWKRYEIDVVTRNSSRMIRKSYIISNNAFNYDIAGICKSCNRASWKVQRTCKSHRIICIINESCIS